VTVGNENTMRYKALFLLNKEIRQAKSALARAEGKPNVTKSELDQLKLKVEALDYTFDVVTQKGW
jgi:hypothetical protein